MKRFLIATLGALLCFISIGAQKTTVWNNPTTEFGTEYGDGFFYTAIDVTKVELKDTETNVFVTLRLRSDYPQYLFLFTKNTYLLANGERYPVVSADGIEFDKYRQTEADGKLDMVFHFKPLPRDTKVFDFIEGDNERAYQVKGIRPVEERHKMLFPSYWRNEQTGNWDIAFLDNYAIYDCKVWDMQADVNHKTGEAKITLTHNGKNINVLVGKNKKGKRTISIDGKKALYSMITGRFLPDYPMKDTRTDFVDTNYKMDTVTIVGWKKDMPAHHRGEKFFNFAVNDLFLDEQTEYYAEMDSLGRFTIKIPLINSSEFFCDWSRCCLRTMFEPGKTYFLLYDFKEGRRLFMGDDARLQNELFKYPLQWKSIRMERGADFDKYIASTDSLIKTQHAYIDELCRQHPMLSTRFNLYHKGNTTWQQAQAFGQARFNATDHCLTDNARKYAYDNFWTKREKPYTLHRDFSHFMSDYINDVINRSFNTIDYIEELAANQEELEVLKVWKKMMEEANQAINAVSDMEEKQRIANEYNTKYAKEIKQVEAIVNSSHFQQGTFCIGIKHQMQQLDSLGADQMLKSAWVARLAYQQLDHDRKSMSQQVMDSLKAWINNPTVSESIEKRNNHYIALENREFDKLILNTGKDVAGMTEGEEILKKLLEPYKGKIVLIDIWGTWCGPCKDALSHSEEEYARMAKYDMQFVYFANRSPMDSWENVIKEYNVTGPNVTHFNLPAEQQSAIERYLQVYSFPTYKLVDKNGNVLDLQVHARDLNGLEELVKTLSNN
ncbi:MAG: TlpA family protein disulfide reductase [Prevotella sp.]|nr:TlpA family protein disulfide reductase [Prevotella sp.]